MPETFREALLDATMMMLSLCAVLSLGTFCYQVVKSNDPQYLDIKQEKNLLLFSFLCLVTMAGVVAYIYEK
jgi:hypothetical protein